MSVTAQSSEPAAARHALPDPGERGPALAWPTVGLFGCAFALFVAGSVAAVRHSLPAAVTVGMNAVACFAMFTVGHDASDYSISSTRWVNTAFGRIAWLFVSPALAFNSFAFIHIQHHRHSNDDQQDPDTWASHGRWCSRRCAGPPWTWPTCRTTAATCRAGPAPRWPRPPSC